MRASFSYYLYPVALELLSPLTTLFRLYENELMPVDINGFHAVVTTQYVQDAGPQQCQLQQGKWQDHPQAQQCESDGYPEGDDGYASKKESSAARCQGGVGTDHDLMRVRSLVACRNRQLVSLGCLVQSDIVLLFFIARVFVIFSMPFFTRLQILQECVNLSQISIGYSSINRKRVQEIMRENPRLSLTVLA
jgi:hypothetical protein